MSPERRDELQIERWRAKTIGTIRNECAVQLQKLVRMRAAVAKEQSYVDKVGVYRTIATPLGIVACVTCGKLLEWKEAQGGHFVSRARAATKLDQTNVHCQCVHCNDYSKPLDRYEDFINRKYGRCHAHTLRSRSQTATMYIGHDRESCAEAIRTYRDEIKKLRKGLE